MSEPTPQPEYSLEQLDAETGGALTAETSSQRTEKLRIWLDAQPDAALLQAVYKELSSRDKGAAKPLREALDALRREKNQDQLAQEWADKAHSLLQNEKLPIATAMAWQQDAAKAGAPLSKEPLASLKNELAQRIKMIEDVHTSIQVQREAAVLLAQRIDLLSTKSWQQAQSAQTALQADIERWHSQAQALQHNTAWQAIESRYVNQLEAATQQLTQVASAFTEALNQAQLAAEDSNQDLPSVPVWADAIQAQRSTHAHETGELTEAQRQQQADAQQAITASIDHLSKTLEHGHSKAGIAAAQQLRQLLKQHAAYLDETLDQQAKAALNQAQELKDWQRWRADQLRQELVQQAQALLHPVSSDAANTATEAAANESLETAEAVEAALPTSPHSPRKLQELLRSLRDQWKQTDQGGTPNQALWKEFDQACNAAYRIVAHWLADKKQQAAAQKNMRVELLAELEAWGAEFAQQAQNNPDWKTAARTLSAFSRRWREAGHVSEKTFAELQPQWKAAFAQASEPLNTVQKSSVEVRKQLIAQAHTLAEQPLDVDAIKALQQSWQQEAQRVPLERRQEQKLWEAFNKPINQVFQRKSQQRQETKEALQQHDHAVLAAAEALQVASKQEDARAIRAAIDALHTAMQAPETPAAQAAATSTADDSAAATLDVATEAAETATEATSEATSEATTETEPEADNSPKKPAPAAKPMVAMRGDDRPNAQQHTAAASNTRQYKREPQRDSRRKAKPARAPKLSNTAFRAQRQALENAQVALRKLAAQAHGESITQLIHAWQQRQAETLPTAQALGKAISSATHSQWKAAIGATAQTDAKACNQALLRLEMAAEIPTPAAHLEARRNLQLQLLTQRNDPSPQQTWQQDAAAVLAAAFDDSAADRLQKALKVLMKK